MTESADHVIGGGLAGSEAAWQIARARRAGRAARDAPACVPPRPTRPRRWPSSSARTRSAPTTSENNAVGLLHEEMRRLGSLIMRAADANQVPAGGALAVDRDGFAAPSPRRSTAHPLIDIRREEIAGLPPEDWDSVIVATGPLTSPALAEAIRSSPARTRSPSSTPSRRSCIATRSTCRSPGSSRATTRPARADRAPTTSIARSRASNTTPSSMRCSPATRSRSTNGKRDALFRRLPADRGDGRARTRDAAARPDEAVRPHQSARARPRSPMRSCSCARTTGSARCSTWSASRPSSSTASRCASSAPFRASSSAEFARLGGLHRNTFLNSPEAARRDVAAARRAAAALCRPDHRLRGLCGIGRDRAAGRPLRRRRAAAASRSRRRRRPPRMARCSPTSPAAMSRPIDAGPRSFQPMNVNFGLFPPLAHALKGENGERLRGTAKDAGEEARALRARARRSRALDRRRLATPRPRNDARWPCRARSSGAGRSGVVLKRDVLLDRRARPLSARRPARSRPCCAGSTTCRGGASRLARHLFDARAPRARASPGELGVAPPLLFAGRQALVRGWIDGVPLHIAKPHGERGYFRSAKAALRELHRAGICHNDLAKEQNWLRGTDGRAYLTDFQLATRFPAPQPAVPHRGL